MSTLRFAVLKVGDEWRVVSATRKIGHFASWRSAFLAACGLCREAQDSGHDVELLTHRPTGELARELPPKIRETMTSPTAY